MVSATDELLGRRCDLVAQRRDLKARLTGLAQDIAALDKVLRILDPAYSPEAGRTNRRGAAVENPFGHGEMTAAALAALRGFGRPATSAECARAMLSANGANDDGATQAQIASRVTAVFSQKAAPGQVRRAGNGDGRQALWETAR